MSVVDHISSRANPFIKDLRRLAQDASAYRSQGAVWLEGDHLVDAAVGRGLRLQTLVLAQSACPDLPQTWSQAAGRIVRVPDALWREFSALPSPAGLGAVLDLPPAASLKHDGACVVLDRLQDAGNVGSILRSAAAFGVGQVLALQGTAGLWSPKVLRAGMGAHFALDLFEGLRPSDVLNLKAPLAVTSSHQGQLLHEQPPPWPCAWVFGHEGQGVDPALLANARYRVRIFQPAGQESLNVASAAAICLHASAVLAAAGRL
jgi:TrmH family RNA methyltransferase